MSFYDGTWQFLDARSSMQIQSNLDSDIIMAFESAPLRFPELKAKIVMIQEELKREAAGPAWTYSASMMKALKTPATVSARPHADAIDRSVDWRLAAPVM